MSASNALVEQRQEFAAKQRELQDVMELAKDGKVFDLSRKNVLEKLGASDASDALAKVKSRNLELDDLGERLRQSELKEIHGAIDVRNEEREQPFRGGLSHPAGDDNEYKTFGQLFISSKEFETSRKSRTTVPVMLDIGLKTLMTTSAGFAPESIRSGRVVDELTRPIQVLDLIPSGPIEQAVEKYMEETTRTHSAAERAEGGTYAEDAYVYTEKTSDVRSIGSSLPVTDEQLEDEQQVSGLIDQRLRFGVLQRLDGQILTGNGTAPNLKGINNVTGIQTQAKGTDATIVAFMKALTLIRFTGRAQPNGAVFHPNDWQDILLTQNSNGDFLFGNPFMGPGPQSLFGVPVALSDGQTENTGLVGDFANYCRLGERRGISVQIGYSGTQFVEGKRTIRADLRACFTVYRPEAFATITGI